MPSCLVHNFMQNAVKETTLEYQTTRAGQWCITSPSAQGVALPTAWKEVHYGDDAPASCTGETNPSDITQKKIPVRSIYLFPSICI